MFKVQDERLEKFKELCDDQILINCYKNKIEFGCNYNNHIEQQINDILIKIDKIELDLID